MCSIFIDIKITRLKNGHSVFLICPYCKKYPKTLDAFRQHITRNHDSEIGIIEVKKQASKLYRLYKEAKQ